MKAGSPRLLTSASRNFGMPREAIERSLVVGMIRINDDPYKYSALGGSGPGLIVAPPESKKNQKAALKC
jgi:hypothetical protein